MYLRLLHWGTEHLWLSSVVIVYVCLSLLWLSLLYFSPSTLFFINETLKTKLTVRLKIPGLVESEVELPIRAVVLVAYFHYHARVLDAWVRKRIPAVREQFWRIPAVSTREIFVDVPVKIDSTLDRSLRGDKLGRLFARKRTCILISGEGGSGKTSLAVEVAKLAFAEEKTKRLCSHFMIPILIEGDLDEELAQGKDAFVNFVRGVVRSMLHEAEPPSEDLVLHLLTTKRILMIIDGFSEMNDVSRNNMNPLNPSFPPSAVVITSRSKETFDAFEGTTINPVGIEPTRLSKFLDSYLEATGKRGHFENAEFFKMCERLSELVGERDITILLAKLYADQVIAIKERSSTTEIPKNIPELMLQYLNKLNRSETRHRLEDREVHLIAQAVAWECVKERGHSTSAKIEAVLAALGEHTDACPRFEYLKNRLKLVHVTNDARQDRIRFALDPLAEYLAALHFLQRHGNIESEWRELFVRADRVTGGSAMTKEFFLALHDCWVAQEQEINVPTFVVDELVRRTGLAPEAIKLAELQDKMRGQLVTLTSDQDPNVVEEAISWFVQHGDESRRKVPKFIEEEVIPNLRRVTRTGDNAQRRLACAALERLGDRPTSALTDGFTVYDYSPYDDAQL
jgi:hypothetical protein